MGTGAESPDRGPRIEVLIGMIASGKSTYARRRAKDGAIVVSHDDLTAMLHAEYRYEPALRETYRRMEEEIASQALRIGRDAVIDRTHLTRESRRRWYDFRAKYARAYLPSAAAWPELVAVVLPAEPAEVHAMRRFAADPRGRTFDDWLVVARHHAGRHALEPPEHLLFEGFNRVVRVKVQT